MTGRTLSVELARRMAVTRQALAGPRRPRGREGILSLVTELGCLQLDPISAVARSHMLVLWSRLGRFDPRDLHALLYREHRLFEYWAHAASIVVTDDLPLHRLLIAGWRSGNTPMRRRALDWVEKNAELRIHILDELKRRGPLPSRALEDRSQAVWHSTGWNEGRNVGRMLDLLWLQGEVAVADRTGMQRHWDLWERCLPDWRPLELPEAEVVRRAAARSLRALGVATPGQIQAHFTPGRFPGLPAVLAAMEAEGEVLPVQVVEGGRPLAGRWLLHRDDLPLLEALDTGAWRPRLSLLSPFDNLLKDRNRSEQLFGFHHRMEIYVPPAKRVHGYYVLPVLAGERVVGRLEPVLERRTGRIFVRYLSIEPGTKLPADAWRSLAASLRSLAAFTGVERVECAPGIDERLRRAL